MIDWMLWGLGILVVLLLCVIGYAVYDEAVAEKFYLRKDEWECTQSHTETNMLPQSMVGPNGTVTTIMIPQQQVVCDRWERKARP